MINTGECRNILTGILTDIQDKQRHLLKGDINGISELFKNNPRLMPYFSYFFLSTTYGKHENGNYKNPTGTRDRHDRGNARRQNEQKKSKERILLKMVSDIIGRLKHVE